MSYYAKIYQSKNGRWTFKFWSPTKACWYESGEDWGRKSFAECSARKRGFVIIEKEI